MEDLTMAVLETAYTINALFDAFGGGEIGPADFYRNVRKAGNWEPSEVARLGRRALWVNGYWGVSVPVRRD